MAASQNSKTDAQVIVEAALAQGRPVELEGGVPYAVVPADARLQDLEHMLDVPRRARGVIELDTEQSFTAFVAMFKRGWTQIFASERDFKIEAVLNFHDSARDGIARWGDFRAALQMRKTPEWQRWEKADKQPMLQADFAHFLEDNLPDIAEPAGSVLLTIASTMEQKKSVSFASGVRLDNGEVQLQYEEEVRGSAAKGSLQIPSTFTLGIRPFEGTDQYKLQARFRYRIKEGGVLALWFELVRPEDVLRAAFADVRAAVEKGTEIVPFMGRAGAVPRA